MSLPVIFLESRTEDQKVATLGKAMTNAGFLGTEELPSQAQATQFGKEGAKFTLISNSGALELAKLDL